jgi:hypothetical protein
MIKSRKNKTNLTVQFPKTAFFTIEDLLALNAEFIPITLRVRMNNFREDGTVAEIGYLPGGKGRPKKVFCLTPVTKITLEKARQQNVTLIDNAEKLVNVISVTTNQPQTSSPVVTSPSATVATR